MFDIQKQYLMSCCVLSVLALFLTVHTANAQLQITQLKEQYQKTQFVTNGIVDTVIVVPSGIRYAEALNIVQARVRDLTGLVLPVLNADSLPRDVLKTRNVIALGNIATSAFIERLYCEWQVILDLKYPGPGGYVVRSLHNPYGTGKSVIFLGGSDDVGVYEAAREFSARLQGSAVDLSVDRLMIIRLGAGLTPPQIGAQLAGWKVLSWSDSRRKTSHGVVTGYDPATYFGWNPISVAGILYYMTGDTKYLQTFKELALPNTHLVPLQNIRDDAFSDPLDPLVKSHHYRSHLVDRVFDLIEESPEFSDSERLAITQKLFMHQMELDPVHTYTANNPDRHALWHLLNIYSGSMYFSVYYPDPVWHRRLENVRRSFHSLIHDPTWGERDTLEWVSTSIEPVVDFFLMDGSSEFVASGTAKTLMQGLEALMSGEELDDYNKYLSLGLLIKAAYLLKDPRYIWMAQQLGVDLNIFRIGQSYWSTSSMAAHAPTDLAGKITRVPVAKTDLSTVNAPVAAKDAFQLLSYRSGLSVTDDYWLFDGFEGLGRHPYQLNTLLSLRMFGGKSILSGYANDLSIWRNGMTEPRVARSAVLKQQFANNDFAYVRSAVPDMSDAEWDRHFVYVRDSLALVIDQVTPLVAGRFDIVTSWQMGGAVKESGKVFRSCQTANGIAMSCVDIPLQKIASNVVQGKRLVDLHPGQTKSQATIFFETAHPVTFSRLQHGGYLCGGSHTAFVASGPLDHEDISCEAAFVYVDQKQIFLAHATQFRLHGGVLFHSDKPVNVHWNLAGKFLTVAASEATSIQFLTHNKLNTFFVRSSGNTILSAIPPADLHERITSLLKASSHDIVPFENFPTLPPTVADAPIWSLDLGQKLSDLVLAKDSFWTASQDGQTSILSRFDQNGRRLARQVRKGEVLVLFPLSDAFQANNFSVLAGFKDDTLCAFAEDGREVWMVTAAIHPSFRIGDHYEAPWFTNPAAPDNMRGIFSIAVDDFWGNGEQLIALGRPCTVEFRTLNGDLRASVPTRWGTNTALAVLRGNQGSNDTMVLAGKAYTGNPRLSGIDSGYRNVGDALFAATLPDFTDMHAWLQRGMASLQVADINDDGKDEVIYTLSGHWNELRVYDNMGNPLWTKFFGPDKVAGGSGFMRSLSLLDLHERKGLAVLVGTRSGWVNAFDSSGQALWQHQMSGGVTCMTSTDGKGVIVGCDDGALYLVDKTGNAVLLGRMKGSVHKIATWGERILVGSDQGVLSCYSLVH